jgi:hypothetical protein
MKLIGPALLTLALFTLFAPAPTPTPRPPPSQTATPTPPRNERLTPQPTSSCRWFVASTGSASGNGSINKPWSLGYVARGSIGGFIDQIPPAAIEPGDDICLRAGTYHGLYRTAVNGTAAAPIKIHPYPGERVIIDDGTTWPDPRSIGVASVANASNVVSAAGGGFTSADIGARIRFSSFDALVTTVNSPTQVGTSQTNSSGAAVSGRATVGPIPPDGRADTFTISSHYTYVYGLEITNSNPNRTDARLGGIGLDQSARGSKAYNNLIYDAGGLISKNDLASDTEVSWNVGWNNGWDDRNTGLKQGGTGHGIYAANRNGFFKAYDNIMVNGFGFGFHVYSAGTGALNGADIQGNVSVDNGYWTRIKDSPYAPEGRTTTNFLVGHRPISNLTFINNFGFHRAGRIGMNFDLGYSSAVDNPGPATITENTMIGGQNSLSRFQSVDFERNFVASNWPILDWYAPVTKVQHTIDNQTYYFYPSDCGNGEQPFSEELPDANGDLNMRKRSVAQWNAKVFDTHSVVNRCGKRPTGIKVTIRVNPYDPNRANVIVYNPDKLPTVKIDLSMALKYGDKFELRNVQDYFGPLTASGAYQAPVPVNMNGLTVARPVGWNGAMIPSSGPDFGVFVLIKKALE